MTHGGIQLEAFMNVDPRTLTHMGPPSRPLKKNPEAEFQSEFGGAMTLLVWADVSAEGLKALRFFA